MNLVENMDKIYKMTGCLKPCHYMFYKVVRPLIQTSQNPNETQCSFTIWNAYPDTFFKMEVLIYPWTALVADFGGTLGLFLGFSFMTIWDGMETVFRLGRQWNPLWKNREERRVREDI